MISPVKRVVPPMLSRAKVPVPEKLVPVTLAPAALLPVDKVKLYDEPVTAPKVMPAVLLLALVLRVVFAPKVTAPKVIGLLVLLIVPFKVVADGLVALIPPA